MSSARGVHEVELAGRQRLGDDVLMPDLEVGVIERSEESGVDVDGQDACPPGPTRSHSQLAMDPPPAPQLGAVPPGPIPVRSRRRVVVGSKHSSRG